MVRDVGVQPVGGVQADLLATVEDHVVRDVPARGRCPAAARRVDAELPREGRPALGERRVEDLLEAAHAELMLSVVNVVGLAEHTPMPVSAAAWRLSGGLWVVHPAAARRAVVELRQVVDVLRRSGLSDVANRGANIDDEVVRNVVIASSVAEDPSALHTS